MIYSQPDILKVRFKNKDNKIITKHIKIPNDREIIAAEKSGYKVYIEKPYRNNIRRWILASRSIESDKHSARYYSYWTNEKRGIRIFLSLIYYWESDDYRVENPRTEKLSVRFLVQNIRKFPIPRKNEDRSNRTHYLYKDGLYKIEAGRFEIRLEKVRNENIWNPEYWEKIEDIGGNECVVSKKAIVEIKDLFGIRIEKNDVFDEPYYRLEIISNENAIKKNLSILNNNLNKDLVLIRFDRICLHLDNANKSERIKYYNVTERKISCIITSMVRVEKSKNRAFPPEIQR